METKKNVIISSVVVAVVVVILIAIANFAPTPQREALKPTVSQYSSATVTAPEDMPLETFATCLADKGMKFYGAFWCPHCQDQKDHFKTAQKKLPYIECSTEDGFAQNEVCQALNIRSYPTWITASSTRYEGDQSLETLAEASSCPLPSTN